jgi:hypothetical protein
MRGKNDIITFKGENRSYAIVKVTKDKLSKVNYFTASSEKNLDEWKKNTLSKLTAPIFFDTETTKEGLWVAKEKIKFWMDFVQEYKFAEVGLNYLNIWRNYKQEKTQIRLFDYYVHKSMLNDITKKLQDENIQYIVYNQYYGNYVGIIGFSNETIQDIPVILGENSKNLKVEIMHVN